jgi:CRISPR-associated protein Csd2
LAIPVVRHAIYLDLAFLGCQPFGGGGANQYGRDIVASSGHIPNQLAELYEIYDYNHAAVILKHEFPTEFGDIVDVLNAFRISKADITARGGNESNIPKSFSAILRPLGWKEDKLTVETRVGDILVKSPDTHKVDYIKGGVALDLEWNSKDQTFDRDLYAFRTYHELKRISVGVIVTRGGPQFTKDLNAIVGEAKYGASTTWFGKLLPRLEAGRSGGCPVLAFGMKSTLIV